MYVRRVDLDRIKALPTLGARIRASRELVALNRSQFSRKLDVAYTTAIAWEKDEAVPNRDNLAKMSVLTGVPESILLQSEGAPVTEPQYETWSTFLGTEVGKGMNPDERRTLASLHFYGKPPSTETYRALLLALRFGSG